MNFKKAFLAISPMLGVMHQPTDIYLEKDILFNARVGMFIGAGATVALNFRESILLRLLPVGRV